MQTLEGKGMREKIILRWNYAVVWIVALLIGAAVPAAALDDDAQYVAARRGSDPHFITSILRLGACKLPGAPLTASQIRIPWQLYPPESMRLHEEGTVKMKLVLDSDSCVSRATIIQSSGFWRLDAVSIKFVMTLKIAPKATILDDGEQTIIFPIAWGASQRHK
jgi:outer membrane biosynthesis protein TonB